MVIPVEIFSKFVELSRTFYKQTVKAEAFFCFITHCLACCMCLSLFYRVSSFHFNILDSFITTVLVGEPVLVGGWCGLQI